MEKAWNLHQFEEKTAEFVKCRIGVRLAGKGIAACSGGADSVAMLYALAAMRDGGWDIEIEVGHVNHCLRGAESDADEQFVLDEAARLGFAVHSVRVDVVGFAAERKLSVETAARQLRLAALERMAAENGCKWIATAHHADDNAETVVQRLARGTGYKGLAGIWPVREANGVVYVRPLLGVRRAEVVEYLRAKGLKWREDHTNADVGYRRNYIRHRLLPYLNMERGDVAAAISELSAAAYKLNVKVEAATARLWETAEVGERMVKVDVAKFCQAGEAVQVGFLGKGLDAIGCGTGQMNLGHYKRVIKKCERFEKSERCETCEKGKSRMELPGGAAAVFEYGELSIINRKYRGQDANVMEIGVEIPCKFESQGFFIEAVIKDVPGPETLKMNLDSMVEWFDMDKVKGRLVLRQRSDGDRFVPLGKTRGKKVGRFLTDNKMPNVDRSRCMVVADEEKIIWVWPMRISEEVKISSRTRKAARITITRLGTD